MDTANISGRRIQEARRKKRLTQVEMAAALEVDYGINLVQSDISEMERGVRGIKDYELDAMARILEVDPAWLMRGEV